MAATRKPNPISMPGLVIGLAALITFLCGFIYLYIRRRRRLRRENEYTLNKTKLLTRSHSPPSQTHRELSDLSNYLSPASQEKQLGLLPTNPRLNTTNNHPIPNPLASHAFIFPFAPRPIDPPLPPPAAARSSPRPQSTTSHASSAGKRNAIYELPSDEAWLANLHKGVVTPAGGRESEVGWGELGREEQIRRKQRLKRSLVLRIP